LINKKKMNPEGSKKRKFPFQLTRDPSATATSIAECRHLLDAIERNDPESVKKTKFTEIVIDALVARTVVRNPWVGIPLNIVKQILLCLPAKECWRIASTLNKAFRKWVFKKVKVWKIELFVLVNKTGEFSYCATYCSDQTKLEFFKSDTKIRHYRLRMEQLCIELFERQPHDEGTRKWKPQQYWGFKNCRKLQILWKASTKDVLRSNLTGKDRDTFHSLTLTLNK